MLGAVIRNGNNTLVVDLPLPVTELQEKLNAIGIQETSEKIKLSDEDGDPIRVKLYATTAEETHLLPLLAPSRTLADANSSVEITNNRYKFSYGRKPKGERLKKILIPQYPPKYVTDYTIEKVVSSFTSVLENL